MGNKVIGYSGSQSASKKEVYVDISMDSKPFVPFNSKKSTYKIDKLVNVKAVQNSIANLFRWIPGERVILPEYGSNLQKLLYRGITTETEEAIIAEIRYSISTWEPRVQLENIVNVSTVSDTENNTIRIMIIYTILGLNDEQFAYTYEYQRGS